MYNKIIKKIILAILALLFVGGPIIAMIFQLSWFWSKYPSYSERIFYGLPSFVAPACIIIVIVYAIRFHGASKKDGQAQTTAHHLADLIGLLSSTVLLFFFSLFIGGLVYQHHLIWEYIIMGLFELFILYVLASFLARISGYFYQGIAAILVGFYISFGLSVNTISPDWRVSIGIAFITFFIVLPLFRWLLNKNILSSKIFFGIRSGSGKGRRRGFYYGFRNDNMNTEEKKLTNN